MMNLNDLTIIELCFMAFGINQCIRHIKPRLPLYSEVFQGEIYLFVCLNGLLFSFVEKRKRRLIVCLQKKTDSS